MSGTSGTEFDSVHRAAFFDLDKTLIPGSSLFLLARGLYQRDFYRVRDILFLGWEQMKFRLMGERDSGIDTAREAALTFVQGRTRREMEEMVREIAREQILPRVYSSITHVIEQHIRHGHRTYLTTASPQALADIVAENLDMTGAIGTRAEINSEGIYTGRLTSPLMHGEAKAQTVRELAEEKQIRLEESFAYSDSVNDLPLLELVGHPQVVNPDRRLRRIARERGWPMFELRPRRLALLIGIPSAFAGLLLFGSGVALGMWLQQRKAEA